MRWFERNLRNAIGRAALLVAFGLTGCSNSCFIFLSSNGGSGVVVKAGNPPPVCSPTAAYGAIRAVALKSPVCESCTAAAKVQHLFVTPRGIQLRRSTIVDGESSDWLEIASDLVGEARQVDLIGTSEPDILIETGIVPAGSYTAVRLRLLPESPSNQDGFPAQNACGETRTRWNCVIMADGRVEPLGLSGELAEVLILLGSEDEALLVLPGSKIDLQFSLEPRRVLYFSSSEGLRPQYVLAGHVTVVRHTGM